METITVTKNVDFGFRYVLPSSITIQSFVTIKWQEKKLAIIKIFRFLFLTTLMPNYVSNFTSIK